MHRLKSNCFEDEQIESALNEVGRFGQGVFPLVTDRNYARTPVNKQGEESAAANCRRSARESPGWPGKMVDCGTMPRENGQLRAIRSDTTRGKCFWNKGLRGRQAKQKSAKTKVGSRTSIG
jgi:hypothetical protein